MAQGFNICGGEFGRHSFHLPFRVDSHPLPPQPPGSGRELTRFLHGFAKLRASSHLLAWWPAGNLPYVARGYARILGLLYGLLGVETFAAHINV